jgi:Na+-driven multidrug efflux pump
MHAARLRWPLFHEILRIGAVASVTTVQTNLTIAITTALVGHRFGTDAVAGYGTGARLEYLLVPLAFGVGGPLVAMVGANIGAGNRTRAIRVAFTGAAIAFAMTEAVGIAAAIWPNAWLRLFGDEPGMLAAGGGYLRAVGPFFGFFGAGMALYFASQGAGRLTWPLVASTTRFLAATVGGWALLQLTSAMSGLFSALAVGLVLVGTLNALAIARGAWFPPRRGGGSTRSDVTSGNDGARLPGRGRDPSYAGAPFRRSRSSVLCMGRARRVVRAARARANRDTRQ